MPPYPYLFTYLTTFSIRPHCFVLAGQAISTTDREAGGPEDLGTGTRCVRHVCTLTSTLSRCRYIVLPRRFA